MQSCSHTGRSLFRKRFSKKDPLKHIYQFEVRDNNGKVCGRYPLCEAGLDEAKEKRRQIRCDHTNGIKLVQKQTETKDLVTVKFPAARLQNQGYVVLERNMKNSRKNTKLSLRRVRQVYLTKMRAWRKKTSACRMDSPKRRSFPRRNFTIWRIIMTLKLYTWISFASRTWR